MSRINLEEYLTADDNLMVFVRVTEDILSEIRDEMENDDNDDTDPSQSLLTSQEAFQSVPKGIFSSISSSTNDDAKP
ncbi:hypothetical protein AVEN_203243-1, partial [Araneus ventricosus]